MLAGGCFWGMQDLFRHPGVAEAIEIMFDPGQLSYRQILEFPLTHPHPGPIP